MSIVGPRPERPELAEKYCERVPEFDYRLKVKAGLTGYAQVNGRNAISWEEKFRLDVEYVDNITFVGDIKIIFGTVRAVLKRDGISSETSATMEEFYGSEKQ